MLSLYLTSKILLDGVYLHNENDVAGKLPQLMIPFHDFSVHMISLPFVHALHTPNLQNKAFNEWQSASATTSLVIQVTRFLPDKISAKESL